MSVNFKTQLETIEPSVPDALYRRLSREANLSYLRTDNAIIGFRVDQTEPISGLSLIAVRKHSILAYCDNKKLILFPNLEYLTDPEYKLEQINVTQIEIYDDSFNGKDTYKGNLVELALRLPREDVKNDNIDDVADALSDTADEIKQQKIDVEKTQNLIKTKTFKTEEAKELERMLMGDAESTPARPTPIRPTPIKPTFQRPIRSNTPEETPPQKPQDAIKQLNVTRLYDLVTEAIRLGMNDQLAQHIINHSLNKYNRLDDQIRASKDIMAQLFEKGKHIID